MGWFAACLRHVSPLIENRRAAGTAAIGVLAGAVLLVGLCDLPREQRAATGLVEHTLEVVGTASTLEAHLAEVVAEGRNYVISPETGIRQRTNAAAAKVAGDLALLRTLISDGPVQVQKVDRLAPLIDARVEVLLASMNQRASQDDAGLQHSIKTHPGVILTDKIAQLIGDIQAEERRLLALRKSHADAAATATVLALTACGIVAAASVLLAVAAIAGRRRDQGHRRVDALLSTILQTASGLIYAKDLQGRMLAANHAVLAFLGKGWDELAGRTEPEFLDDSAQARAIMANDRRVIDTGRTQVLEESAGTDGEGRARIWLSIKTPMRDVDGAIIGMVGMSMDITDRKRTEERLQAFNAELEASVTARTVDLAASEARQRAYFRHSPIGMVVMRVAGDGDFVLEDINPSARAAFGFATDDPRGQKQSALWPETVACEIQKKMQACASRRQVIDYSETRTIDGESRELDIVLAPLLDDALEARLLLVCVRDVTRQRALERQVVEQAEHLAEAAGSEMTLFDNSADGLFIVRVEDRDGVPDFIYQALSPASETVTGLNPREMVGRRPTESLPAVVADQVLAIYRRCFEEQSTVKFAETRLLAVGQRELEGWVSPVRHPATARIVRLVGSVRDVTERNRLEAALRHRQRLEAIGVLAAGVAHDFNNILQAVIGGLDLVMDDLADGTAAREFAAVAMGSAMRGSQLTHHLLSYARKQMLLPQTIDVATFLTDIRTLLARTLGPHITIKLCVDHGLRTHADPSQLQTALLNLAINAAHAMPRDGVLTLQAQAASDGARAWMMLTVSDTGVGMDAATLAQAVEPFFTTKGLEGAGLGLSMVQGFAEQSGGTLDIASSPGCGTRVTLRLPAVAAPQAASATPPAATEPQHPAGRVLLVDDSTDVLVTVGAFLQNAGFHVVRADSGHRALEILATDDRFNAMVSDYAMPGINGLDLIAQAREAQPDLHVLLITGYTALGDAAAQRGMTILHKPFLRHDLLAALHHVMAGDDRIDSWASVRDGGAVAALDGRVEQLGSKAG